MRWLKIWPNLMSWSISALRPLKRTWWIISLNLFTFLMYMYRFLVRTTALTTLEEYFHSWGFAYELCQNGWNRARRCGFHWKIILIKNPIESCQWWLRCRCVYYGVETVPFLLIDTLEENCAFKQKCVIKFENSATIWKIS